MFVREDVRPHADYPSLAGAAELHVLNSLAGIEVPDLVLRHSVQGGKIVARDQEVDRRRSFAAPGWAKETAFTREWFKSERFDYCPCGGGNRHPVIVVRTCIPGQVRVTPAST